MHCRCNIGFCHAGTESLSVHVSGILSDTSKPAAFTTITVASALVIGAFGLKVLSGYPLTISLLSKSAKNSAAQ